MHFCSGVDSTYAGDPRSAQVAAIRDHETGCVLTMCGRFTIAIL